MNTGNAGIYTFQFFAEDGEGPTQFNTYTVTYVTNEGTGSMELVTVTEGASHTLLANGFTAPENKHFAGWKVNDDDTLRAPGYVIENITADVTVTAQWESDSAADTKLFKLVTSVDQLKAGDKVIIVSTNNGSGYGMGYQNGNVRAALAVSGISGKIVLADSAFSTAQDYTQLTEFTLGGNAAAGWTFYDAEYDGGNGGYLGAVSSGSNYIGTQADVDGEAQFDLVFGSNGAAQATAKGENTRNTIRYNYNNGNPRFSCYGSNSNLSPTIYIYKELTDGYWLVGPDWTIDGIDIGNNFISNPGNDSEYMLTTSLKAGDQFKVAKVENNAITKFNPDTWNHNDGQGEVVTKPYGYYDDQKLTADGNYTIYFKPNYTGGDDWYYKCIYVVTNSTKPTFMTQSLTLGDEIGVNFYLNLDMLDADTKAASYMTFAITGKGAGDLKTTKVPFDAEKTNDKGYYGFTCRVNALQMADTITATLHYGDGQTIEKTYSVKQYILKFMENKDDYSEKTVNLVMALADYGHYVQAMLAAQKGFELGPTTYAEMDTFYTTYTTSYDFEDIRSKVAEKGITFNNDNGAAFSKLSFMMVFDSATELRILFKTPSTGTIAATVDGKSAEVTTIGTSKAVQIKEIPAHWLSHPFTIVITIDGSSATITASALSYVKLLLATDNATYQHAAAAAIYNYSVAADAYKTANTNP